jgi:hypothetical protein
MIAKKLYLFVGATGVDACQARCKIAWENGLKPHCPVEHLSSYVNLHLRICVNT